MAKGDDVDEQDEGFSPATIMAILGLIGIVGFFLFSASAGGGL
jgi:hypothetical protein